VMWIWIGGLIVFGGALLAIWPAGGRASYSLRRRLLLARPSALEIERDAKYREIRDAELDYRVGKLSRTDYEAVDAALRAEAVAILDRIDPPADAEGSESPEEPEPRVLART